MLVSAVFISSPPPPSKPLPLFFPSCQGPRGCLGFLLFICRYSLIACQLPREASVAARAIINTLTAPPAPPLPRLAGKSASPPLREARPRIIIRLPVWRRAFPRRVSSQDNRRRSRLVKTSAPFYICRSRESVKTLMDAVYQNGRREQRPGSSTPPPAGDCNVRNLTSKI